MAPALRGATTAGTGASGSLTSYTVNKPAGVAAGDLLLIYVVLRGSSAPATPTGFTAIPATVFSSTYGQLFWRVADGSESATFTISWAVQNQSAAVCLAYTGVNTAAPFDPTPTDGGTGGTGGFSDVGPTTTRPGTTLVWVAGEKNAVTGAAPGVFGVPAGFTRTAAQYSTSNGAQPNLAVTAADMAQSSPGAVGTVTATDSLSTDHDVSLVFGLAAAVSVPASVSDADTGTGVDVGAVQESGRFVSAADTGVGVDAAGTAAAAASSETGHGADTAATSAGLSSTDTGLAVEAGTPQEVSRAVTATDTGNGVEGAGVDQGSVATKTTGDTGAGTDTAILAVNVAAADTGLAAGAAASSATFAAASDIGHGTDVAGSSAGASGQDTGASADAPAAPVVSVAAADTGRAVEGAGVDQGSVATKTTGDTGLAVEGVSVAVGTTAASVSTADTGHAVDLAAAVYVTVAAADVFGAVDAATVVVALTAAETAAWAELAQAFEQSRSTVAAADRGVFTGTVVGVVKPGGSLSSRHTVGVTSSSNRLVGAGTSNVRTR